MSSQASLEHEYNLDDSLESRMGSHEVVPFNSTHVIIQSFDDILAEPDRGKLLIKLWVFLTHLL